MSSASFVACPPASETPVWLRSAPVVAIDFETYYSAQYSVQVMGYTQYVEDPRFHAELVAVSDGEQAFAVPPDRFPWTVLHGRSLVAHNAAFDRAVFLRLQRSGTIPAEIVPASWDDTAALCAYLAAPRALDEAASVLLGLTLDKGVRARMRQGGDLFDRADDYAAQDARAAALLWRKFSPYWPERERALARLTIAMGERGISIDRKKAAQVFQSLEDQAESARLALPWYPKQPPTSPKAIAAVCQKHGIPAPETTSAKEDAFDDWLAEHGQSEPARYIRLVQEIRSLNRSAKVLETMLDRIRTDGRIDAHTLYFGAAPGRWSGGGHGLNLQNLNRSADEEEAGTGAGADDLRGCLVPAPGHVFVIVDLSQIEPRCLAWMAGDRAWLDLVRGGMNPYEAHARVAHGWQGRKLKQENGRLYALCKAERLGLGYGCGWQKFVSVARTLGGIDVPAEESRRIVTSFRRNNPAITSLWQRLEQAFTARHGHDYRLPLPSGRRLRYFEVDAQTMTARVPRGGPRLNFYGGKLCENLIQGIARDVFAEGLLRVEEAGLNPILSVHDEVICEVPDYCGPDALEAVLQRMTQPPAWAPDLPVAAEGQVATFYRK